MALFPAESSSHPVVWWFPCCPSIVEGKQCDLTETGPSTESRSALLSTQPSVNLNVYSLSLNHHHIVSDQITHFHGQRSTIWLMLTEFPHILAPTSSPRSNWTHRIMEQLAEDSAQSQLGNNTLRDWVGG